MYFFSLIVNLLFDCQLWEGIIGRSKEDQRDKRFERLKRSEQSVCISLHIFVIIFQNNLYVKKKKAGVYFPIQKIPISSQS